MTYMDSRLDKAIHKANNLVLVMIILELLDALIIIPLDQFGIVPWSVRGLVGILFAPLLHGSWQHLLVNTVPLWVNTVLLFSERGFRPGWTFCMIWLGSGVGTWMLGGFRGNETVHIGASALIFGFVTYLSLMGILLGRLVTILVSLLVIFCFGGILSGVVPNLSMPYISWEAHLSGALVGIILAVHNGFLRSKVHASPL